MPEIIVKNQALEKNIETFVNWYYNRHPAEATAFEELVKRESENLINENGMSKEGCFMAMGMVPQHMYSVLKQAMRIALGIDDFWRDYSNYKLFYKVWRNAMIRRKPKQWLRVTPLTPTT